MYVWYSAKFFLKWEMFQTKVAEKTKLKTHLRSNNVPPPPPNNFFFFFFRWRYSPLWALAWRTIPLHLSVSITNSLHLLTPNTWRSLSTSSLHTFLGLPLRLVPSSSWVKIFLGILSSSILSTWPSQLILCPFIHFTIFSPLFNSSSSRFVLIFHSSSSYLFFSEYIVEKCCTTGQATDDNIIQHMRFSSWITKAIHTHTHTHTHAHSEYVIRIALQRQQAWSDPQRMI